MIFWSVISFIFGLGILVKGSDTFVESAANIARSLGVSMFVIGLSLVAIGTSLPELASSVIAAMQGHPELVLGNIVGSNIANIALVLALAVLFAGRIKIVKKIYEYDYTIMLLSTILLLVFSLDGTISRAEGIFLLIAFMYYLFYIFKYRPQYNKLFQFKKFLDFFYHLSDHIGNQVAGLKNHDQIVKEIMEHGQTKKKQAMNLSETVNFTELTEKIKEVKSEPDYFLKKEAFFCLAGLAGLIIGAKLMIDGAIDIAVYLQVPDTLIGLTLIAVGTSVPELAVCISSVKKKLGNLLVGNIVGSNITNILLVLAASSIISDVPVAKLMSTYAIAFLTGIILLFAMALRADMKIDKREAMIFIFLYIVFIVGLIPTLGLNGG